MNKITNASLAMLDQHVAPTFVLDPNGRVIVWNRACAVLTGLPAIDVINTKITGKRFTVSSAHASRTWS